MTSQFITITGRSDRVGIGKNRNAWDKRVRRESCTIDNSPGDCKSLQDCPKVYEELLAGKMPSQTCGFVGFNPIVCCPKINHVTQPTPTPAPQKETTVRTNTMRPLKLDESRSVARAKCAENAEAVYGFIVPPTPTLNRKPLNTSLCALKTRKLIVGGKKAEAKEFPHMAAVGFDGSDKILWLCGGTLISKKIVLTAAHCLWTADWGNAKWVRLGDLNLVQSYDDAKPQTIEVKERIRHPDYKRPSEYHDIAILRLARDAVYDAYVRPACLPVDWPDVGENDKAVATGWGLVDWADDQGSDNLLKVTLRLVPHENCNASFFDSGSSVELALGIVNEWQMCAGEVGKDTCQGDSGGPLAVFNTNHQCMYTIIGITSLGRLCGSIIPGVYTRVYHYVPWIERTAWPEYF
ncbi:Serine protease persephone [Acromyrmex echinatior]|uniref:Serine protease persephone n=1 Tax=Acromyrmex echinatior TaxID=103372 RepID=F4W9V7_ACREC|nr:Serine protease persephone [Acromyrmex echinatior]